MFTMLSVDSIIAHENNPRMNIGDLTELSDSIKINGILQPLTVVPFANGYKVIIGHRRLAAAQMAGLTEVPCEVKELTEDQQLNIMMMENMMRENLTTYEEAKGFQMMLDLGKTVEQVASETGFSQTTIRKRTKLLTLDEDKFKAAVQKGATLADFCELNKIESEATRNAVLEFAGTKDFKSKLNQAIENEAHDKAIAAAELKISEWAKPITTVGMVDGQPVSMRFESTFWPGREIPEKGEAEEHYYIKSKYSIKIYAKGDPNEEAARKEKEEHDKMIEHELGAVAARCHNLRVDFLTNFKAYKKYGDIIMRRFMKAAFKDRMRNSWRSTGNIEVVSKILGVESAENFDNLADLPIERVALAFIACDIESSRLCTWRSVWIKNTYVYVYDPNDKLADYYEFLMRLGYKLSEEEINMVNGDVENVQKEAVA